MAKINGPLMSQEARGQFGKKLTFQKRPSGNVVYGYSKPGDLGPFDPSAIQIARRAKYADGVSVWNNLTTQQKAQYETQADILRITAFNYFMKLYLNSQIIFESKIFSWKKITIDYTKVAEDLVNYPLYIDLAHLGTDFFSAVKNGGGDIRIVADDMVSEKAREVVTCDTTAETGELHTLIASLSSTENTVIYVLYSNAQTSEPAADSEFGSEAVWVNYAYVAHMENGNLSKPASTAFSVVGSVAYATGKLGKGLSLNEKLNGLTLSNVFDDFAAKSWVIQFWLKHNSVHISDVYNEQIALITNWTSSPYLAWTMRVGKYNFRYQDVNRDTQCTGNQVTGEFIAMRGQFEGLRKSKAFINNTLLEEENGASDKINLTDSDLRIGSVAVYSQAPDLVRIYDEMRIANTVQSENYYITETENQNNPATFYSVD